MAKAMIENVGLGTVTLPSPLRGVLAPGERAVVTEYVVEWQEDNS